MDLLTTKEKIHKAFTYCIDEYSFIVYCDGFGVGIDTETLRLIYLYEIEKNDNDEYIKISRKYDQFVEYDHIYMALFLFGVFALILAFS